MILASTFLEFAAILGLAAILGIIGLLLRQPLIVVFIVVGILAGPAAFNIVKSHENIHLLAEIGISILLFIVGLKLDLGIIRHVGKVALLTGLGQVIFTAAIGFAITWLMGFSWLESLYIAVALTFSSTIIIVKLLSDKKEIDALHGQIAIGFLIVQDIVVILIMILLSTMQKPGTSVSADLLGTAAAGLGMLALTWVAYRWVIPRLTVILARSQELLTLFAIAWATGLSALGSWLGFSGEVGAFLAGVSLASTAYRNTIGSRLTSLRDFLLLFFFVNLGANLDLNIIGQHVTPAVVLSLFVLIGNPLIVMIIMGVMGYRKRTGLLAGLTVAQISEFSLIFAGMGLAAGHIGEPVLGLITLVGLITIGMSTYMILYSHKLYEWLSPYLGIFERAVPYREAEVGTHESPACDVLILGMGRLGRAVAQMIQRKAPQLRCLGVDFDPQVVRQESEWKIPVMYGDLEDPELTEHLPMRSETMVINTIPDVDIALQLLQHWQWHEYKGPLLLTAANETDAAILRRYPHAQVFMVHQLAAEYFFEEQVLPYTGSRAQSVKFTERP